MKKLFFIYLLLITIPGFSQTKPGLKLWYKTPSGTTWENALPIGNGRLGAMIYGNVEKEIIQLNEHTVWSGGPNRNDNPMALDSLARIRQLIFAGKQKAAEKIANQAIITKKSHGQMFQPVGNLELSFPDQQNYSSYYRELDIENAVAKTVYKVNGVTYTREVFASFPDRVIVVRISADKPGQLSFTAGFTSEHKKQKITVNKNNELSLWGTASS